MSQTQFDRTAGVGALFDLSFTRFITISMIKVIYVLAMVLLGLGWLAFVIAGFSQGVVQGLGMMIIATIAAFLYLLWIRVALELVVVIFRIGENTSINLYWGLNEPLWGLGDVVTLTDASGETQAQYTVSQ